MTRLPSTPGSPLPLLVLVVAVGLSVGVVVTLGRAMAGRAQRRPPPGRGWLAGLGRDKPSRTGARWARSRDLRPLVVTGPAPGRLVLGRSGRRWVAAEVAQSVIVVGPTQSHKTTGFAVPALLEWDGPVVATSVKTDLVRDTLAWRERLGQVWLYDPTGSTGLPAARWSPLAASQTWVGARRTAAGLCGTARSHAGGPAEADFWFALAAKLLAPLLLAAAGAGRSMADVVRWVDEQEVEEVVALLERSGAAQAVQAARATWMREERQRSSVYTTAEAVLEAFADPTVAASSAWSEIDPGRLIDGGSHTLFACAPAHEQRRLQPVFAALVDQVLASAYDQVTRSGRPLAPPLLVVLDEAANIAPLAELDTLAATAAGHGIQLVTVWQDMAQIAARYGERAATVVNNHRAKVVLSGISDPGTLDHVSRLVGEEEYAQAATTRDRQGGRSTTESRSSRRLAPADALRRIRPGHGVLVYGHLPPCRLRLRPWYADQRLAARAGSDVCR